MANPQVENGYTKIANELIEALYRSKLNGTQFRIALSIIRYTYGFSKTETNMSLSFISISTNIADRQVRRELDALISMKVIKVAKETNFYESRQLKLNKNYEEWTCYTSAIDTHGLIRPRTKKTTEEGTKKTTVKTVVETDETVCNDDIIGVNHGLIRPRTKKTTNKEIINKTINKTDSPKNHKEFVTYFCEKHKEVTTYPYQFQKGKDAAILADLLKVYDTDFIKNLIDWFFVTDDKFVKEAGCSIGVMKTVVPKFISFNTKKTEPKKRDPYQEA